MPIRTIQRMRIFLVLWILPGLLLAPSPSSIHAAGPQLSDLTVTPQTLAVQSGAQSVTVSVLASDADGDLKNVKVKVQRKDGTKEKVALVDDGTGADAVAQDGRFTVEVLLATDKAECVSLTVTAKDEEKTKARLATRVSIIDPTAAPVLSELRIDPPILDPDGGDQLVTISVRVDDPDGDLKNVKLDRLDKPGGFTIAEKLGRLLDDGQGSDAVAGDGLYHLEVTVTPDEAVIPLRVTAKDVIKNKNAQEISLTARPLSLATADVLQSEFVIVSGTITDAATGNLLGRDAAQPLTVTLHGESRDAVVDGVGRQVSVLTLEQGLVTLYLRNVLPSFDQPTRLTVLASSPGFLTSSANVTVTSPNLTQFTLDLVRIDPTVMPEGVELAQEVGMADVDGAITDVMTIATPPEPVTQATTTVAIPLGSRIFDQQGNPLTGEFMTTVTYHNPISPDALDTVPGGLNDVSVLGGRIQPLGQQSTTRSQVRAQVSTPDHGYFISGGMAAVEIIDANGIRAGTVDQPITITLTVPSSTVNPLTNAPVQAGDLIPTWSYNTTSATWVPLGDQSLVAADDGNLNVMIATDQLSFVTAAWPFTFSGSTFATDSPDGCARSRIVQVEGNATDAVLNFRIRREGGGYNNTFVNTSFHVRDPDTNDPDRLVVPGAPREKPVMVEAFLENTMIGDVPVSDLCDAQAGNVMVNVDPQIEATDVTVQVHDVCPDDRRVQVGVPSVPVVFQRVDGNGGFASAGVTNAEGTIELPGLKIGAEYVFQALDRRTGTFASRRVTVAESTNAVLFDFDLPKSCGSDDPLRLSFALANNGLALRDDSGAQQVGVGRLSGNTATMAGTADVVRTETLGIDLTFASDRGTGTQVGELIVGLDSREDLRRAVARFSPVALAATTDGITIDVADARIDIGVTDLTGTTVPTALPIANNRVLRADGDTVSFDLAALNDAVQANALPPIDLGTGTVQYTVSLVGITLRLAAGGEACPEAASCRDIIAVQGTVGQAAPVGVSQPIALIVLKDGKGTGSITSAPDGISCGQVCGANFAPGAVVTLIATPGDGSTFVGWNGACTGTGTCVVSLTASETVGATFAAGTQPALTVSLTGTGSGTVESFPSGITCGLDCSQEYAAGTTVLLSAKPAAASTFGGWSGSGCSGTVDCVVNLTTSQTVTATFNRSLSDGLPQSTLAVTTSGTGGGTVTSFPTGLNCGADCTEEYMPDTTVLLTATPDAGSSFTGWSGGGCSGTTSCAVAMSADQSVTATFSSTTTTQFTLTGAKGGTGEGTITSSPVGIACGADCTEPYAEGTAVTLTASPDANSTFAGWSGGGCSGTVTCVVSMTSNPTVTATFNASGPGPLTFGPILKFAGGVSGNPRSMLTADLDQDGNLDLVTANPGLKQVMVLYGNGDGTFVTPRLFGIGAADGPSALAVGDVNGDGLLDIATANSGDTDGDSASVILGLPGRLFSAPNVVVTGLSLPLSVALGDVNGDGNLDLAVSTRLTQPGLVKLLLGDGAGSFSASVDITVGTDDGLGQMRLDDVSQDGNLDLIVVNSNQDRVFVLNGDGLGGFSPEGSPTANSQTIGGVPKNVLVGDLNNDGKRDIVVVNRRDESGAAVFLSTNPSDVATFTRLRFDFSAGVRSDFGALGDLNGDGVPDIAVANGNVDTVSLLMGDGFGSFTMLPDISFDAGDFPKSIAIGDFNEDGRPDLAVAAAAKYTAVLLNTTIFP